jgi:DNA gyrase/topoisomerase IV subunit A
MNLYTRASFIGIVITTLLILTTGQSILAQKPPVIKISSDGIIRLPEQEEIKNTYLLDVSELNFENEDQLISFLKDKHQDSYLLRASSTPKTAVMVLKIPDQTGRSKQEWRDKIIKESSQKPLKK